MSVDTAERAEQDRLDTLYRAWKRSPTPMLRNLLELAELAEMPWDVMLLKRILAERDAEGAA